MESAVGLTWSARLLARTGIEPVWAGALLGFALAAIPWAIEGAEGHVALVFAGDLDTINLRAPTIAMLLVGLAPAAQLYLARWTNRHIEQIARVVPGGVPGAAAARPGVGPALVSALVVTALFGVPMADWDGYRRGDAFTLHGLYVWPMTLVLGWCLGRFLEALLRDSLLVSRLAERLPALNLFEMRTLRPFVQQGLRGALLMVVLLSLTAVLAVSPGRALVSSLLAMAAAVWVAVIALLLPTRGLRRRIRLEKQSQLARLRAAIDTARRAVLDGTAATDVVTRLPGLLALEARIEAVREWPFDLNAISRFGFYLLLGLGSWVGAAGVEVLLNWTLGVS